MVKHEFGTSLKNELVAFSNFTSLYPPVELFAGCASPTAKQKALEQRCILVCEDIYNFEYELLRDMRTAVRDLLVCYEFFENLKPVNLVKYYPPVEVYLDRVKKKFSAVYKKEPTLVEYLSKNMPLISTDVVATFKADWTILTGDPVLGMEKYKEEKRNVLELFKTKGY